MESTEYLNRFEEKLTELVLQICTAKKALDGQLLQVEELEEKWNAVASEYMADAVPEFNQFPTSSIAWAAYFGMASAVIWDTAWEHFKDSTDFYSKIVSPRGFDELDEYVTEEVIGYKAESEEAIKLEELMQQCSRAAYSMMRNESVESGTSEAFYLFARTAKVFFKLGVALELKQLGYSYKKVSLNQLQQLS